ncbi:MAG: epoxide hydrolase N-terminal domain-containing protein, partial [Planctomycetota bacterium]
MTAQPFEVEFTADAIDDLRRRLEHTRWPAEVSDSGWDLGTNLAYLQELCGYWQRDFDFEA